MNLPDFLVELPYNEIRLKGSRIGLYHVIWCHREQGFDQVGMLQFRLHELL